ncbi:MAG: o-succinylbenzoate--CoA ligase [Rhodospirillaceae bacterium]|nr:MAG: o-succinylbenzoate--CoA ligase [Rhodospirillaceae bacterium]
MTALGSNTSAGLIAEGCALTLDALQDRALRAAALFQSLGVNEGDCVALLLRNRAPLIVATLGAQHLGAYAVPINWHFAPAEVAYVVKDCGARVLLVEADLRPALADDALEGLAVLIADVAGWDETLDQRMPIATDSKTAVQSMIYTSGTTGRPKGVRRAPASPQQAAAADRARKEIYGSEPGMRLLMSAPLYHSAPNRFALTALQQMGLLVLEQKFDALATLRAIEAHAITHMFMVPTMFVRLRALPEADRKRHDLSSLRWIIHAGAPCPPEVKAAMIDWWGPVINEYYGSTETGPITFVNSRDALRHGGTVGRPVQGVVLSIRDEVGNPCPPNQPGEIVVDQSSQADFTYHGVDGHDHGTETGGGWATGDIGYLDADGFLYICDRRTDMIISGGVNIYPAEIEAELIRIAGVRDCAVIGVPDAEFGEAVVGIVEVAAGVTPPTDDAIKAILKGRIAGYKVPRRIIFASALPRDDSGKIYKRKLRDSLA